MCGLYNEVLAKGAFNTCLSNNLERKRICQIVKLDSLFIVVYVQDVAMKVRFLRKEDMWSSWDGAVSFFLYR